MTGLLVLLILLALLVALVLVFVIRIYLVLWAIRAETLPTLIRVLEGPSEDEEEPIFDHVHAFGFVGHRVQGVFIVWAWREERWHYIPQAGVTDPGVPPSFSGAFEGDIAKTWTPVPIPTESSQSSTRAPSP